jgi:uncharacterized protein (DUF2141 family)
MHLLVLLVVFYLCLPVCSSQEGLLQIKLQGLNPENGKIFLAVHNTNENFPNARGAFLTRIVSLQNSQNKIELPLPYGTYAISLFQDQNGNGTLDFNKIGFPKEAYAVSNNVYKLSRPASFNEASFKLNTQIKQIQMSMKH